LIDQCFSVADNFLIPSESRVNKSDTMADSDLTHSQTLNITIIKYQ